MEKDKIFHKNQLYDKQLEIINVVCFEAIRKWLLRKKA